ncbi:MAG: SDR family NAD(P)-dependent oxidoreductase, partial [Pirellulales bacterium]|nr:SDR family NAD(P)-dependent oxidoreductase [Pirellulales bacterium]
MSPHIRPPAAKTVSTAQALILSARSWPALRALAQRYADCLASSAAPEFADLCFTAAVGRTRFRHRVAIVAGTPQTALARLRVVADCEVPRADESAGIFCAHLERQAAVADRLSPQSRQRLEHLDAASVARLQELVPGEALVGSGAQSAALSHDVGAAPNPTALVTLLAALDVAGAEVDWRHWYGSERRRRVPLPTYPFEREPLWIEPLSLPDATAGEPAAVPAGVASGEADSLAGWFQEIVWRPAPPGARRDLPQGPYLLFADELGVGAALAGGLRAAGRRVVEVHPGRAFRRVAQDVYTLNPARGGDYRSLFVALDESTVSVSVLIHLGSLRSEPLAGSLADLHGRLADGVESLFHLHGQLAERDRPCEVLIVTGHAQGIGPEGEVACPDGAALAAFARSIPLETPQLATRTIDLVPGAEPQELAAWIEAELGQQPGLRDVAYRSHARLVPAIVPVDLATEPTDRSPSIRAGGVYLITGGQGEIGLALAHRLAAQAPGIKLVLANRKSLDESPDGGRRRERIATLAALGAEVWPVACDVTDARAVAELLAQIEERFGALHGVIHAAGSLQDGMLWSRTLDEVRSVMSAKVDGAWLLHELAQGSSLDFFVCCSSTAGFAPLAGQASYAAASAFLDGLALARRALGFPALSIDWGFWGDTSAAAPERYRRFVEAHGVRPIATAQGVAAFETALHLGRARLAVFPPPVAATPAIASVQPDLADPRPGAGDAHWAQVVLAGRLASHRAAEPLLPRLPEFARQGEAIDRLVARYVAAAFRQLRLFGRRGRAWRLEELVERARLVGNYPRLLPRLLAILVEDQWLQHTEAGFVRMRSWAQLDPRAGGQRLRRRYPAARPQLELLTACGEHLAQVLTGQVDPLDLLFPGGSLSEAASAIADSPFARFYNELAAAVLQSMLGESQRASGQSSGKIIEIGAGTGGTSCALLPVARAAAWSYCYTDVSTAFLRRAAQQFAGEPRVDFRALDIEQAPADQGFEPGQFDVVVAANVLHATRSLDETLGHVSQLLAPGGWLLLLESTSRSRWGDLTFGLTEGWWRFADRELRTDSPLVDRAQWLALLARHGFAHAVALPDDVPGLEHVGQHLFIASSSQQQSATHSQAGSRAPALRSRKPKRSRRARTPNQQAKRRLHDDAALLARLTDQVRHELSAVLHVSAAKVEQDASFQDQGVDSLLALELIDRLKKSLGLPSLRPAILFQCPTVDELAAHLVGTYGERLEEGERAAASSSASRAVPERAAASAAPAAALSAAPAASVVSGSGVAVIGYALRLPG